MKCDRCNADARGPFWFTTQGGRKKRRVLCLRHVLEWLQSPEGRKAPRMWRNVDEQEADSEQTH